jgi:YHS domain
LIGCADGARFESRKAQKFAGLDRAQKMQALIGHRAAQVSILNVKNIRYLEVKMAKDPVCDMDVDETMAKYVSEYKGKKYFFCAPVDAVAEVVAAEAAPIFV